MDSATPQQLKPEIVPVFTEGISLILARWTALEMAIQNEWGGRQSRRKADLLATDILTFFTHSKEPIYIDDLEELLYVNTSEALNLDIQDGSVEEVAEELMIMHEELLNNDLKSIEKLRKAGSASEAVSRSKAVVTETNEDVESSGDEATDMVVDDPMSKLEPKSEAMPLGEQKERETVEAEDGWSVVSSKRNKGKRRSNF